MYYFAIAATVAMIAVSADGCSLSSPIYPQTRVVVEPAKIDFGLVGTWRGVPTENSPNIDINDDFSISMNADGVYKLECKAFASFAITLRATELDEDSGYAIVDVDILADDEHYGRYLVLAKRKDDELCIWWIESKNIAAKLHNAGHSGVVERGTFSTRVHVKPSDLLDCVRKYSKELVGEPTKLKLIIK